MNYTAVLYGPVYRRQGVNTTLTVDGVDYPNVRMLDKTSGISLPGGGIEVETIRPAAMVQAADLIALGLDGHDLDNALLKMNGKDWRINSTQPKPSPNGEGDGEFYLFLEAV